MRVAIDIGGTFTDSVAIDERGGIRTGKAPTTPGQLHDGVLAAIDQLDIDWAEIEGLTHGTTVGLNAFLEGRGANVALLTTEGFRDVYEIGRANRPDMYNLRYRPPTPLVPRRSIFEVTERLAPDGSEIIPIDDTAVRELGRMLAGRYDAIAICFLHAWANPAHEQYVAGLLRDIDPALPIVCSHDISPEWREYERTSTTVITAYIAPIVSQYLLTLEERVKALGLTTPMRVMQSNGGVTTASVARTNPIQTLFSGPVGGTIAAVAVARDLQGELDVDRLICVDMGGTSFDMSLVIDGQADVVSEFKLNGHPILASTVSIHSVGAGGGSVGHTEGGGLRVGPRSAGAEPGPACYGGGGTEPTITDANLRLGRIPPSAQLGGEISLDMSLADSALATVGEIVGLSSVELSAGMIAIADAAMANAISEVTVLRGIDPREFALVAFGGAGPLHAAAIADELGIDTVIVPADPGVLSAYGMLQSDIRHDAVHSFYARVADTTPEALDAALGALEERGRLMLKEDEVDDEEVVLEPSADMRYSGQEYTVSIPLDLRDGTESLLATIPDTFSKAHELRYGHSNPGEAVEFVNLRMAAYGKIERPRRGELDKGEIVASVGVDQTWFGGRWIETPVYLRETLLAGARVTGPAILLENACTTLLPPNWEMGVSTHGHLLLTRGTGSSGDDV